MDEEARPVDSAAFRQRLNAFRASTSPKKRPAALSPADAAVSNFELVIDSSPSPTKKRAQRSPLSDSSCFVELPSTASPSPSRSSRQSSSSSSIDQDYIDKVTSTSNKQSKSPTKKKKKPPRPYADPSAYSHLRGLTDYLVPGLDLIVCGINPGIRSATDGHHYAHPTNYFWRCLAGSGLTDRLFHPSEGYTLPTVGIGSTNLVPRPSAEMSELSKQEMIECVPALLNKVLTNRPRVVNFVGMGIAEVVFRWLDQERQRMLLDAATPPEEEEEKVTIKKQEGDSDDDTSDVEVEKALRSSPTKKARVTKGATPKKPKVRKIAIGLQDVFISYSKPSAPASLGGSADGQRSHRVKREPSEDALKAETKETSTDRTYFYVVPSTSARVVAYQLNDQIALWKDLKAFVDCLKNDDGRSLGLDDKVSKGELEAWDADDLTSRVHAALPRADRVIERAIALKREEKG